MIFSSDIASAIDEAAGAVDRIVVLGWETGRVPGNVDDQRIGRMSDRALVAELEKFGS